METAKQNILDEALAMANQKTVEDGLTLPVDGFSPLVAQFIEEVTKVYQTSREAVISACLTIGGVAAGKKVQTFDGRYYNNLSLFTCFVAPSGSNKSETLKKPLTPLEDLNRKSFQTYKTILDDWKNSKKNSPRPAWANQVLFGGDVTSEALTVGLSQNVGGALQYSDELSIVFGNLQRYNKNSGASTYLSLFDGRDVTINRKNDDSLLIEKPFLSLIGSTQPGILPQIFTPDMMAAGLPQRFLFVVQPGPTISYYSEATLDRGTVERWGNLIGRIFNAPNARTLIIQGDAKSAYIDFYNRMQEAKMSDNGYMCACSSKLQILVQRVAGIIHMLNENPRNEITVDEMRFAVSMMPYFYRTQRMVYDILSDGMDTQLSKSDLLKQLFQAWPTASKSAIAGVLGINRVNIYKMIK